MVEIYRIKDIIEDVEAETDFISGKINQIVIDTQGIQQFVQIEFFTENDELISKIAPNQGKSIITPRRRVVDEIDTGHYEEYLVHGNLRFKVTGLNEEVKINEITIYLE